MGKYSLIALDMDGTLFNSELKIPEGNREAVRRAHEAGKHVVLSTGRCLSEIRDTLRILTEIRYLVCENGSCVYDAKYGKTLHVDPVPANEVRRILELVRSEKVAIQVFSENISYFNAADASWVDRCGVGNYRGVFEKGSIFNAGLFDTYDAQPFRIEKINLYFESIEDRNRISAKLADRPLKTADSMGYMLEIVSEMADKGRGLQMLCDYLKLPVEETIAVGDSMNDVEILETAGLSAAMGNACPEAKAAADFITADCDHDGVAQVIYEYLLK